MIKNYLRRKALHLLTKHLFNAVTEEDVLRTTEKGGIMCKGKALSREMLDQMQNEAEYINNSITFKLLMDDMRYLANQTMYEKSGSFEDMMFGKAMLYNIEVLDKKLKKLAK